jgi:prepilin-type N-terminal cleavage/methylation domain-containing protein
MNTFNLKLHAGKARFKKDERREAFTLIELLVTISILVVLAGLLLPALTRAKAQAHSAVCKNNLRQLQLGWRAYAEASDDKLVPNLTRSTMLCDIEHRESLYGSWVLGNAQTDTTTENIQKGLLFAHTPSALVYRCPSDRSTVTDHKIRRRAATDEFFPNAQSVPLLVRIVGKDTCSVWMSGDRSRPKPGILSYPTRPASSFSSMCMSAPSTRVDLTSIPLWKSGNICRLAGIARGATSLLLMAMLDIIAGIIRRSFAPRPSR